MMTGGEGGGLGTTQALKEIELNSATGKRSFFFPNSINVAVQTEEIFSGRTYPIPEFLIGHIAAVFDIGANIGTATVYLALHFTDVPIFAFEPQTLAFELLERNVEGLTNVTAIHSALLDRDGRFPMAWGGAAGEASSIKNSIMTVSNSIEWVEARKARTEIERLAQGRRPLALKIDTEGCEVDILGDLGSILDDVAVVFAEYHSEDDRREIDRILCDSGMMLNAASASHCHAGDVVYLKKDLIEAHRNYAQYAIT